VPCYVASYSAEQRRVLELVPGVTDVASIRYVAESALLAESLDPEHVYVSEIVPDKIRLNLAYAAHATVWSDVWVILATLHRLFWSRDGSARRTVRSEEHTSELQSRFDLVCRLLLEKKK